MSDQELESAFMSTAADFIRGDVGDDKTRLGGLLLTANEGETWDVFRYDDGRNPMKFYIDTIAPKRFGGAQILAAYLLKLNHSDAEMPDLPKEGKHQGELID